MQEAEGERAPLSPTLDGTVSTQQIEDAIRQVNNPALVTMPFLVVQKPSNAPSKEVTHVALTGADGDGTFEQLDSSAKEKAGSDALTATAALFPQAELELQVVDATRLRIITGTMEPHTQPVVTVLK